MRPEQPGHAGRGDTVAVPHAGNDLVLDGKAQPPLQKDIGYRPVEEEARRPGQPEGGENGAVHLLIGFGRGNGSGFVFMIADHPEANVLIVGGLHSSSHDPVKFIPIPFGAGYRLIGVHIAIRQGSAPVLGMEIQRGPVEQGQGGGRRPGAHQAQSCHGKEKQQGGLGAAGAAEQENSQRRNEGGHQAVPAHAQDGGK